MGPVVHSETPYETISSTILWVAAGPVFWSLLSSAYNFQPIFIYSISFCWPQNSESAGHLTFINSASMWSVVPSETPYEAILQSRVESV